MSTFYNKDRNISGLSELTGISYSPEYGSSVVFEAKNNSFLYSDRQVSLQSAGVNNVIGKFNLNFNLRENSAQSLVNFYESQSGTGIFPIQDGSNIYKTLSGSIDSLNLSTDNNDKYQVSLSFDVERNSSVLNWSGQSFVNQSFTKWRTGVSFSLDDIVYFENDLEDPCNNIFYCVSGHVSSFANHPLSTGRAWTKTLFENPNSSFTIQQSPAIAKNEFNGAFSERIKNQKNIHSFENLDLSYKNISDKTLKSLLFFLESKLGYKRFEYQIPEIYNRPKLFFSPTWTHKWNYKDSNDLTISLTEDPFGMIPSGKPNAYIVQNSGRSSLGLLITGNGNLFFNTGNGKQLITGTSNLFSWPNSAIKNSVKIYGRIAGLSGISQGITRAEIFTPERLYLNLSGNSLTNLNLYHSSNLERINIANNRISGFDFNGFSSLKWADLTNNSGSYLNIGGCSNLTGVYASGNVFPQTHVDGAILSLKNGGLYSGYANFIGSSGVSLGTIENISNLSGKGWNIEYNYYPVPTIQQEKVSSSASPSFPPGYSFAIAISDNHEDACMLSATDSCYGDAATFDTCFYFNFPDENSISSYAVGQTFYIQNSDKTFLVRKICCDKAVVVSGPTECGPPSISPSSVSNSAISNSLPSNPSPSVSPSDGNGSISPSP